MRLSLPVLLILAAPTLAQEPLSAEEMARRFTLQREALEPGPDPELGGTRGLKLVTGDETAKPTAQAGKVTVPELAPELQVNVQIGFAFDSAVLAESEIAKIALLCQALEASAVERLRILGHTDAKGGADYNQRLSELRAEEVARRITDTCGIAPDRIETVGMGERMPVNRQDPRADENRRVEFQAVG